MIKFKKKIKYLISLALLVVGVLSLFACGKNAAYDVSNSASNIISNTTVATNDEYKIDIDGTYTSKEEVALYIYTYKKLPKNFITKKEAKKLGWDSSKNYLGEVAKGKSIGGDVYSNYEKRLPVIDGRKYYECDIDYAGKKRNAKRIVYADDFNEDIGFIYYTDDHYKTFERLY